MCFSDLESKVQSLVLLTSMTLLLWSYACSDVNIKINGYTHLRFECLSEAVTILLGKKKKKKLSGVLFSAGASSPLHNSIHTATLVRD